VSLCDGSLGRGGGERVVGGERGGGVAGLEVGG